MSMARCLSGESMEKLRPVMLLPVTSSSSLNTPIWRQMASAVSLLSPVMTITCAWADVSEPTYLPDSGTWADLSRCKWSGSEVMQARPAA